jgi:hypothetical protein
MFTEDFNVHWIDVWVELKGHSFEVYPNEEAKEPLLCFDLKVSALSISRCIRGVGPSPPAEPGSQPP